MPDYLILTYRTFRRLLKISKAILSLVLLVLTIAKKFLDLFDIS